MRLFSEGKMRQYNEIFNNFFGGGSWSFDWCVCGGRESRKLSSH
jgi:hypothetical protein